MHESFLCEYTNFMYLLYSSKEDMGMEREMGYYSYIVPDLSNHIFLLAVVCRRRFVGSWT